MNVFTQETEKEKGSTWEVDGERGRVGGEHWPHTHYMCGDGMMKPTVWIMKHANGKKKMALGLACVLQIVFFPSLTHSQTWPTPPWSDDQLLRPLLFQVPPGALQSLTWTLQLLGS